jgi:predicted anti-sigma-YlaC factor YlaD
LEPELLVAEFAGELPPDVALAVREHIVLCETCGERSAKLREPYELLAALGSEPVPFVPDLRDTVRTHARRGHAYRSVLRVAGVASRAGAIGIASVIGVVVVVAFLIVGVLYTASAQSVSRSSNGLSHVPAAASGGTLLAATDKVVPIQDSAGATWQVGEVIAVDEHTGAVRHSLPASSQSLHTAQAGQLPIAIVASPDGRTLYELTSPNSKRQQALIAIDIQSGKVRYVTPLALPGTRGLPAQSPADALAISPDSSQAYIGLALPHPDATGVRILVVGTHDGKISSTMSPSVSQTIPEPPPPGSLPSSVFPNQIPQLDATGGTFTLAAGGALAVSPDGQWLYDLLTLHTPSSGQYGVVRRISVTTGETVQELALSGDFTLTQLLISNPTQTPAPATPTATPATPATPELLVVKGSPDAQVFVMDVTATGPTLLGDIALGGPPSPENVTFSGQLSASPSSDGTQLYVAQNASAENGLIVGHDLWQVDIQGMGVLAHRLDSDAADAVLANASGVASDPEFILRGGEVLLIAPDLSGQPTAWLNLSDGHPVLQLLAAEQ